MMNSQHSSHWSSLLAAVVMSVIGVAAAAASLEPNWLEVHLVDKQAGKPVANAAVCLGTSARSDQFGAKRTDSSGVARFEDIRPNALMLTVSMPGYQGRQQMLEPLYESRVLVVTLVTGGGGPVCDAPQAAADADMGSGLSVGEVSVRADINSPQATGVLVSVNTSGPVNQIRISEQPDFKNADWEPYKAAVPFTLSPGAGVKQLYVQVRRAAQVQGASIEVVSPVKRVLYQVR
jgi:hypothetical protein